MISADSQPSSYFPLRINKSQETQAIVPLKFPSTRNILWESKPVGDLESVSLTSSKNQDMQLFIVEKSLRLAYRYSEEEETTSFLLGSAYAKSEEGGICFGVDRFDPGREVTDKIGNNITKYKVPTAVVPGDHVIPIKVKNQQLSASDSTSHARDEFVRALQLIESKICGKDSLTLSHIMSLKANVYCCKDETELTLNLHCGAVVPNTVFQVLPIAPLPIIPTALARNLAGPLRLSDVQGTPKMGYITMDQTRKLLLLLECDPKVYSLPLIGIWLSGVQSIHHPYVWASCLRFLNCSEMKDRVLHRSGRFLLLHYTVVQKMPDFWECCPENNEGLDFELRSCQDQLRIDLDENCAKDPLCFFLSTAKDGINKTLFDEALTEWKNSQENSTRLSQQNVPCSPTIGEALPNVNRDEKPRPLPSPHPSPTQGMALPVPEDVLSLSIDELSSKMDKQGFVRKPRAGVGNANILAPHFNKPVKVGQKSEEPSRPPFKEINSPNQTPHVRAKSNTPNRRQKKDNKENSPVTSRYCEYSPLPSKTLENTSPVQKIVQNKVTEGSSINNRKKSSVTSRSQDMKKSQVNNFDACHKSTKQDNPVTPAPVYNLLSPKTTDNDFENADVLTGFKDIRRRSKQLKNETPEQTDDKYFRVVKEGVNQHNHQTCATRNRHTPTSEETNSPKLQKQGVPESSVGRHHNSVSDNNLPNDNPFVNFQEDKHPSYLPATDIPSNSVDKKKLSNSDSSESRHITNNGVFPNSNDKKRRYSLNTGESPNTRIVQQNNPVSAQSSGSLVVGEEDEQTCFSSQSNEKQDKENVDIRNGKLLEQLQKQEDMIRVLQGQVRSLLQLKEEMSSPVQRHVPLTPASTPEDNGRRYSENRIEKHFHSNKSYTIAVQAESDINQTCYSDNVDASKPSCVAIGVNTGASLLWNNPQETNATCLHCSESNRSTKTETEQHLNCEETLLKDEDDMLTPDETESLVEVSDVQIKDATTESVVTLDVVDIPSYVDSSSAVPEHRKSNLDECHATSESLLEETPPNDNIPDVKGKEYYDELLCQVKDLLSERIGENSSCEQKSAEALQRKTSLQVPAREDVVKATLRELEKMKNNKSDGCESPSRQPGSSSKIFSTRQRSLSSSFIPDHVRLNYISMTADETFDETSNLDEIALKYLSEKEVQEFKSDMRSRSFARTVRFGSLPYSENERKASSSSIKEVDFTWNNLSMCTKNYLTKYNLVERQVSMTTVEQDNTDVLSNIKQSQDSLADPYKPPLPSPAPKAKEQKNILDIQRLKKLPKLF